MEWKSSSIEKLERITEEFFSNDKTIEWYGKRGLEKEEEEILRKFLVERGKVLDLMCGTGRVAIYLAKLGFEVVGVDKSPKMVNVAKERAKKEKVKVKFFVADASEIKLPKAYFDYILVFENSLEHIPSQKKRLDILYSISRSLKKGGIFITSFHSFFFPPEVFLKLLWKRVSQNNSDLIFKVKGKDLFFHFFTPFEIRRVLKNVGLKIVSVEPRRFVFSKRLSRIVKVFKLSPFFYSFYIARRL